MMIIPFVFFIFLRTTIILSTGTGTTALTLKITPVRAHITAGTRLKIMCHADVPVVACQFKRTFIPKIYDLSLGPLTPNNTEYEYYGAGLDVGDCGINMKEYVKDHQYDLVGCRVREATGAWKYAAMSVIINANETYQFDLDPTEIVVRSGNNVSILCRADQPLSSCFFKWPTQQAAVSVNNTLATPDYRYFGAGLEKGHCGLTLIGVKPAMSGDVYCSAWTRMRPKGYESDTTALIVAVPPSTTRLTVNQITAYTVGDTLEARCISRYSCPVSNLTWYLDGDVVRADDVNEAPVETAWLWSYKARSMEQTFRRNVTWEDDGKELRCVAAHMALIKGKQEARTRINVKYAPRDIQQPITVRGFDVGDTVELLVSVQANPQPIFTWTMGNQTTLGELDNIQDGRIQVPRGTKYAKVWEARLIISNLKYEDFLSDFLLTAKNEIGKMTYRIVLDGPKTPQTTPTVPEPELTDPTETTNLGLPSTKDSTPTVSATTEMVDVTETVVTVGTVRTVRTTAAQMPIDVVDVTTSLENLVVKNESGNAQKHSRDGKGGSSHAALIISMLALCVVVCLAMLSWYARANSRWCFSRQQFASAQLRTSLVVDEEDSVTDNFHVNL